MRMTVRYEVLYSNCIVTPLYLQVYTMLLGKLKAARKYTDIAVHGTMKLTAYFGVMSYCVVSRVEKLMVSMRSLYLLDLLSILLSSVKTT